jgi:very-short-patch-repair endonuclease
MSGERPGEGLLSCSSVLSRHAGALSSTSPRRTGRARQRLVFYAAPAIIAPVDPVSHARQLRRDQTKDERQLWQALRAGRFVGFKFRRQHPAGGYFLDFYCPIARVSVELDGFGHGLPKQRQRDLDRERFLESEGIQELRFWNHQWRNNREGVLLEIWYALHQRTGCVQVIRKSENQLFAPPDPQRLRAKPPQPPTWHPPGMERSG